MSLTQFAHEFGDLPSSEQTQLTQAVRRLLADGLIWREDENDRPIYSFLVRRRELVADYLAVAGWELRHEERISAFHVVHREGAHRRRLSREATVWLLLLRLIYAEKRERLEVSLTRYPVVEVGAVIQRYAQFFPGQPVRKKGRLDEALRTLHTLKLIRAAGGGGLRAGNTDQLIELLPTLEVVAPAPSAAALAERLRAYGRIADPDESAADDTQE